MCLFQQSVGAICDYIRHSIRPLLSTLVDITSCNDVIKTLPDGFINQYNYLIHKNTWRSLSGFSALLDVWCKV